MSRSSAKRPVRNPFVVTVAAAAALLAPGCGARVDAVPSDAGTGSDTQPIECPSLLPTHGSSCSGDLSCNYPDTCAGTTTVCENGKWNVMIATCNPPPPDCPPSEPANGSSCSSEPSWGGCSYPDRCMPGNYLSYACTGGRWRMTTPPIAVACPTTPPTHGSSCAECVGRYPSSCVYEWCGSYPSRESICDVVTKKWDSRWASCNPPPPDAGPGPEDPDAGSAPDPGAP